MVLTHKTLGYLSYVETGRVPKTFFGGALVKKRMMPMSTITWLFFTMKIWVTKEKLLSITGRILSSVPMPGMR